MSTPGRLRRTAALIVVAAGLTATAATAGIIRMNTDVHAIATDAAPGAAVAAELYFALSDLDNQVATLIMLGADERLATNRLDALRTYQQRTTEVDGYLLALGRDAHSGADRTAVDTVADGLRVYREWVWQAISAAATLPPAPAADPPAPTRGYYAEATNVLRGDLLPRVAAIRAVRADRLAAAYAGERTAALMTGALTGLLGAILIVGLVRWQVWLARRFRRVVNPGLATATALALAAVLGVATLAALSTARLGAAQHDDFAPYLALTATQALGYDAAGDTSRYLIASDPAVVGAGMRAKSSCVGGSGPCPASVAPAPSRAGGLWRAYERDRDHAVALAEAGDRAGAVDVLTSITSGGAAIDFDAYNRVVSADAEDRRSAAGRAFDAIQADVRPWTVIPAAALGLSAALVLFGIRARLAEYR